VAVVHARFDLFTSRSVTLSTSSTENGFLRVIGHAAAHRLDNVIHVAKAGEDDNGKEGYFP